jgi:hypothetical protein
MLFHVTAKIFDEIVLDADKRVRNEVVGPQLQRILESGKVRESGLLSGKRAVFFVMDIDAPEELYEVIGPEIYSAAEVDAHPVTSIEKAGELFQRWASEGR